MMEWLFWTIILSTSLYGLDKLYSPGSLWGCNSNKASLITKWQYYGEIRNLRNTNLGVLLLSSRALVIAINWDGPSPLPPSFPHLFPTSAKVQTWEINLSSGKHDWVLLLLFLVDKIHHIIVGIDFLSWLHFAVSGNTGSKLLTSN